MACARLQGSVSEPVDRVVWRRMSKTSHRCLLSVFTQTLILALLLPMIQAQRRNKTTCHSRFRPFTQTGTRQEQGATYEPWIDRICLRVRLQTAQQGCPWKRRTGPVRNSRSVVKSHNSTSSATKRDFFILSKKHKRSSSLEAQGFWYKSIQSGNADLLETVSYHGHPRHTLGAL